MGEPYDLYFLQKDYQRLITSRNPTGRVIFQDNFEGSQLDWASVAQYGSSGGSGALATGISFAGNGSLKIQTGVTDSGGWEVSKRMPKLPLPSMRLGLEFYWYWHGNNILATPQHRLQFGLEVCGGPADAHKDTATVAIDDSGDIYYNAIKSSSLGGTLLGHSDFIAGQQYCMYNYAKLVIDARGGIGATKYAYLIMNHTRFDMTNIAADYTASAGTDPYHNIEPLFMALNLAGITANQIYQIDDVIVTCEEP